VLELALELGKLTEKWMGEFPHRQVEREERKEQQVKSEAVP